MLGRFYKGSPFYTGSPFSLQTGQHGMNASAPTGRLAAQGAQGMRSRGGRIYVPTDGEGRGHGSGVDAPPGGPGDLPVDSVPD